MPGTYSALRRVSLRGGGESEPALLLAYGATVSTQLWR